ncbi:MAG: TRAP transporter small permease [Treponema sp.]|jgi:TRAP-type C4-dicarboxylate transport system permease small subunit|nr:TRAP transporter small permease [Treponema sp.]
MKKALLFLDEHIEKIFISIMMGYFVVACLLQILFRFIIQKPASWTEETARYAFIWMTFVGSSLGAKLLGHIRVDMLETSLGGRAKTILGIFSQTIFLIFAVVMTVVGIQMCMALVQRPQLSPALKIPMQYVYAAMPVGMGMMSMRIVRGLMSAFKGGK